jgi:hypothetical protein
MANDAPEESQVREFESTKYSLINGLEKAKTRIPVQTPVRDADGS